MLNVILTILSFLLIHTAEAKPVTVTVQSVNVTPYDVAISGVRSVCPTADTQIVLSESPPFHAVQEINAAGPALIFAVGLDALQAVKDIEHLPIVFLMVLKPETVLSSKPNITGVNMNIAQEKQLAIIAKVLPGIRHLALFYDPKQTGALVDRIRMAAPANQIRISAEVATSARQVPTLLTQMSQRPDALWMLPDLTIITSETLESLFQFSMTSKIPLIFFSEKYLSLGAFMSISIDAFDIGRQAGGMANRILSGKAVADLPVMEAEKAVVTINRTVAGKLGISIDESRLGNIKVMD